MNKEKRVSNRYDHDDFGNRMKAYEARQTAEKVMPLLPVYARLDGRGFSKLTKPLARPFCAPFHRAMVETTRELMVEFGAEAGYTQSDEISLLWRNDDREVVMPFDGKYQKLVSSLAAFASVTLYQKLLTELNLSLKTFMDCRVFQLPTRVEAANAFLWREQDASKNAVSMAARTFVKSAKELAGMNSSQMQELMFQNGQNFNDYPAAFRRGTFVLRRQLQKVGYNQYHEPVVVDRNVVQAVSMPVFSTVSNRVAVLFERAEPEVGNAVAV